MKVQSKKDSFFVDTKRDSKKVILVSDYYDPNGYSAEWQYVIIKDGFISDVDDSYYDKNLPVISFEEWQSLPDFPKPEYDPKDVAFKNDYSNSEFNIETFETKCGHVYTENKEIIGYKLIKPEYKEAVREILKNGDSSWFDNFDSNLIESGYNFVFCDVLNSVHNQLETAGVMHWFSPVYDTSITLKSGVKLSEDDIAEVKEILKNL